MSSPLSPPLPSQAFWLCHECGAQMRPIYREDTPHCASCDGEFIEILDADINPDPWQEIPPPPPARSQAPQQSDFPFGHERQPPSQHDPSPGGLVQSLLSGLFGSQQADEPSRSQGSSSERSQGSTRTWHFNAGAGSGSVTFGTIGGVRGRSVDTAGGQGGLDAFFPGFNPPPTAGHRQGGPQRPDPMASFGSDDLLRALMSIVTEDGHEPFLGGGANRGNFGDYVMTEQGFNQVLEQLMQATGPQGPLPASEVVIEGLPRSFLNQADLADGLFKDCPVCKDDFTVGDQIVRIPCKHIFHPDCLVPWLKVNGSCPVCRFSLVPEEAAGPVRPPETGPVGQGQPSTTANPPQASFTNILQRLYGQRGAVSGAPVAPEVAPRPQSVSEGESTGRSEIPEEYRERHRRREREQRDDLIHEDVD